jgi:KaiC/GvpD/RAD55 family RecA-like ATPase
MRLYLLTDSVTHHRQVVRAESLQESIESANVLYTSAYYYGKEMATHIANTGKVKGYKGPVYGEWVILDVDCDEGLEKPTKALINLLLDLEEDNIKYRIFFSGKKGFHLYIHKNYIAYPKEYDNKFNLVARKTAEAIIDFYDDLEPYVDFSIYDAVRVIRAPFSKHNITGEEKKELVFKGDFDDYTKCFAFKRNVVKPDVIDDIFSNADVAPDTEVEPFLSIEKPTLADEARENYGDKEEYDVRDSSASQQYPYGQKLCIHNILHGTSFPNHRNKTALRIMSHFAQNLAMPKSYVHNILKAWNKSLDDPLPNGHINKIIDYYPGYLYNCQDEIKSRYCDKHCIEYPTREDEQEKHVFTGNDFTLLMKELSKESSNSWLVPSRLYPNLNISPIKPSHGHISCLVGGSSSGKTTFLLNLINHFRDINFLFLSYDMAASSFAQVIRKKHNISKEELFNDEVAQQQFSGIMQNVTFVDDSSINVEKIPDYVESISHTMNRKFQVLVIDYLGMVPAKGNGPTERAINIAQTMKNFSKKNNIAVIFLVQVPKYLAGNANMRLGMDSAKDSGEIVNLADHVLTCWRPEKGGQDRVFRIFVAKDKYAPADYDVDLSWEGNHKIGNTPPRPEEIDFTNVEGE